MDNNYENLKKELNDYKIKLARHILEDKLKDEKGTSEMVLHEAKKSININSLLAPITGGIGTYNFITAIECFMKKETGLGLASTAAFVVCGFACYAEISGIIKDVKIRDKEEKKLKDINKRLKKLNPQTTKEVPKAPQPKM